MDTGQFLLGFEIDADMYNKCAQLISDIEIGLNSHGLDQRAVDQIIELCNIALDAFYHKPKDMISLSSIMRQTADTGIYAAQKAIAMVVRRVIIGLPVAQMKIMSSYLSQFLCESKASSNQYIVGYALPEALFAKAKTVLERIHNDNDVDLYRPEVITLLENLLEVGVKAYYETLVDKIEMGRITRAASDLGIKTAHKGTTVVVKNLFKSMPHQEMLPLAHYFESLLHDDVRSLAAFPKSNKL